MEAYLGEVRWLAFDFAPEGWAACNGATLPIMQNQALYSLLGTKFGGDGQTTFALPKVSAEAGLNPCIATNGVYPQRP